MRPTSVRGGWRMGGVWWLAACGLVAVAGGCDDGLDAPKEVECPSDTGPFELGEGRVTGTLEADPLDEPLTRGQVLVVRGSAHHEDGLAIREVRIAGVQSERVDFNFASFTANVPYQSVVSAAPTSAQGQVTITAIAIDACGNRYPFAELVIDVDPTPNVAVDELTMTVEYPDERTFLPADGSTPAILTITGGGRAVGAVVRVQASSGELKGVDEAGDAVLSAPFGTTDVGTATVLFYGATPDTVTVTAVVEDKLASALVEVEGPPELSPRAATLLPGQAIDVEVSAAGDTVWCSAAPSDDLMVTFQDAPLDIEAIEIEADDDGLRLLTLTAADEPLEEVSVTVSCEDVYGQRSSGRYQLSLAGFDPGGEEEPLPEER